MAKAILNETIDAYRGKIGKIVFRMTPSGTLSAGKVPDMSNVEWSEAQKAHRERFGQAVIQAKAALLDPNVRAKYKEAAAKTKGKRAFDLAVSDFYHGRTSLP